MKKILTAIAAAIFLLPPISSFAGYVIHLKDGTKFVTDQYVEEGGQIKFKRYGGLVGIEKNRIREIEEIEDLPEKKEKPAETKASAAVAKTEKKEKTQEQAPGGDAPKPERAGRDEKIGGKGQETEKAKSEGVSEEEKKKAEQEKAAKMQKLLEEKRQIMREKEAAITSYKEAKAMKNMEKKNQCWNELLSLQKKLENLRERAVTENGGGLPDWWDDAR